MAQQAFQTGLYVHIPFCTSKCRYCGFYSVPLSNSDVTAVIEAMLKELDSYQLPPNFAETIYIGGGSPTCIPDEQLFFLIAELISRAGRPTEFTIEANPMQVNYEMLLKLRALGVNRLSIGVQSFNDKDLEFLGRSYKAADIKQTIKSAKGSGFENISIDLIFAIPGQSIADWQRNLESTIEFGIQHVSAYSLSYEKGTPLHNELESGRIAKIDEETDRTMYEMAIQKLRHAGISQYEISNFAGKGFECRHNLTYWANQPWIGIGPAAASYWQGARTANVSNVGEYIEKIKQGHRPVADIDIPDPHRAAHETAILNLRRIKGIDLQEFKEHTGFNALALFSEVINKNKGLGLLKVSSNTIKLTPEALPIADSVLCDFSAG